jgi:4-hydroxybenzoate polyprenyltransferase
METFVKAIKAEVFLSIMFIKNDIWCTIISGTLATLSALKNSDNLHPYLIVSSLATSVVYFWLYIYLFTLGNQINGIEEDRINKPFRPIPSGLVSRDGASQRLLVANTLFLTLGYYGKIFDLALLWTVCSYLHNFKFWSTHWLTRGVVMAAGVYSQLVPGYRIVQPIDDFHHLWFIVLAGVIFIILPLQDLRDMVGDKVVKRQTLPLVYGETFTRYYLAFGMGLVPIVLHFLLFKQLPQTATVILLEAIHVAACWNISKRLLTMSGPVTDHHTYRQWEMWYALMVLESVALL